MRVQFDIPETSLPSALHLVNARGKVLKVRVQCEGRALGCPVIEKRDDEKYTPSQRMRMVLQDEWYGLFATEDAAPEFDKYYRTRMEQITKRIEQGEI